MDKISASWSYLLYSVSDSSNYLGDSGWQYLPGKRGIRSWTFKQTFSFIFKSSPNIQPIDHISIGRLYLFYSKITYGALYQRVVTRSVIWTFFPDKSTSPIPLRVSCLDNRFFFSEGVTSLGWYIYLLESEILSLDSEDFHEFCDEESYGSYSSSFSSYYESSSLISWFSPIHDDKKTYFHQQLLSPTPNHKPEH